jgi:hypothetical protein
MACNGNCAGCSGCGKALELTQGEVDLLNTLAQIPFLPVARKADDMTPVYLEDCTYSPEDYSLILQVLEKKGLIDLDYSTPLKGFDMAAYAGYPVHGTIALTARGQTVVELLDKQGIL